MKILWVNNIFLHPTTKGGQIRTLEILRRLHRRHEIHYAAFADPREPEGLARSSEYSTLAHPVPFEIARKGSFRFFRQVAWGAVSPVPVVVARKRSRAMRRLVDRLVRTGSYDCLVCDFLTPTINIRSLGRWVLFEHNVETMIWRRYHERADDSLRRTYFGLQARRLERYERRVCRQVARVIAVSDIDAAVLRDMLGIQHVTTVSTGVDVDYFTPGVNVPAPTIDLAFFGSMDWPPNIDGAQFFVREILPIVRRRRPNCSVAIVGRTPHESIRRTCGDDPRISITGTVADMRPHLWNTRVSIVPLRIGGGTRLKIYESMAAGVPVVSTTIGAEGLNVRPMEHLRIADTPAAFAEHCLTLLENPAAARHMADAAASWVQSRCSWDDVAQQFEEALDGLLESAGHDASERKAHRDLGLPPDAQAMAVDAIHQGERQRGRGADEAEGRSEYAGKRSGHPDHEDRRWNPYSERG